MVLFEGEYAVFQSPPTYFLARPSNNRESPYAAPPMNLGKRKMTAAMVREVYGTPDEIGGDGAWYYWCSDQGRLLGVAK